MFGQLCSALSLRGAIATWQSAKCREVAFGNRGDLIEFAEVEESSEIPLLSLPPLGWTQRKPPVCLA